MIDLEELNNLLPENGFVVIRRENGETVGLRLVKGDEHISTLNAMLEVAKLAGYSIVAPDGNTL
ncbi:hypothetical protein [Serratia sp. P2ACOL2]|uniref:hypothetical protein n=1 Tax=Serratia sp. P2ACOL2 TaxID=2482769 RepID=UPI000EFA73B2|nr:hypothetical protein [Serratia sp. P2ACOL2]AYO37418.1 hypothetical protein EBA31_08985 [Serratia sp. P2ACOL2]